MSSTYVSTSNRIAIDGAATGLVNMERDLACMHSVVDGKFRAVVRIYRFDPRCISLGRHQRLDQINTDACTRDAIDIVQRPTGGGAVLHADDLTYSVSCMANDPSFGGDVEASCRKIHGVFVGMLADLGISTQLAPAANDERQEARLRLGAVDCFARPARGELCLTNGLKILGSAQMRYGNWLLQHGSLVLQPTPITPYLSDATADSRIAGVGDLLALSWDELADAVAAAFETQFNWGRT